MSDAILILTFGPVQGFIAEARRFGDLRVGSQLLVELAGAAAQAIADEASPEALIFPADLQAGDVPNRLVARVPWERGAAIAEAAKRALQVRWQERACEAEAELARVKAAPPDDTWHEIWQRQIEGHWEVYWSLARLDGEDYAKAYTEADRGLGGAKRLRAFQPAEEQGVKDTLSGRRSALHTQGLNPKSYWQAVAAHYQGARLRTEGRERLDALGAVKRFCRLAESPAPSTSRIAAATYIANLKDTPALRAYEQALQALLGERLRRVQEHPLWPYDGDLLYAETLTAARLQEEHGAKSLDPAALSRAQRALRALHKEQGEPSPYYAVMVLDGDSMGQHISTLQTEEQHREFSRQLARFARWVQEQLPLENLKTGTGPVTIYNGGDDVLAVAPLHTALNLAQGLAETFTTCVQGCTASAGVAVIHHLYPLDAALRAAREAERRAKSVKDKAAVFLRVLKRSGQVTEMRSRWPVLGGNLQELVTLFSDGQGGARLSGRLAYDVLAAAPALPEADDKLQAELFRLLKRHRNSKHPQRLSDEDCRTWAARLRSWAERLPGLEDSQPVAPKSDANQTEKLPGLEDNEPNAPKSGSNQTEELGRWLAFAHWLAQGGRE
ncbi:MAG: type III-B CRISPR-associated protein Cas10/Cmr2 [Anaerolineae bacterium]